MSNTTQEKFRIAEMSAYSIEHTIKIWHNDSGDRVEVGPDKDGLNLVRIAFVNSAENNELIITQEFALMLAEAIQKLYKKV